MSAIEELLESTCKNVIKTILTCLDGATKGTIYRIGPMPALEAVRITSGIRCDGGESIQWGLPTFSDYNPPGKRWEQYRDQPERVLEAMGWCVERQQSWTADNPFEDVRSVGKQLRGEIEDSYHMEPVLVRKRDLYSDCTHLLEYPIDWRGYPIWQDSEFVVAAVIKIHFLPGTLKRGDRSTKIIKELSRSLGTEILSLHLRETLLNSQREFARQRLHSCKILAHELRNTLIKFGFVFSAVNAEIGILREEWEAQLAATLLSEQEEWAAVALLPSQGEKWLENKLWPKWRRLLGETLVWEAERHEIEELLGRLQGALRIGMDAAHIRQMTQLPRELREKWAKVAYMYFTADKAGALAEIIELLSDPQMPLSHKQQMRKVFTSLRALVEVVPEVEERANRIIMSLRYGGALDPEGCLEGACLCQLASPEEDERALWV